LVNFSEDVNTILRDCFKINQGDTIYNMRKGDVAAVPNMYYDADRISSGKSLEIIHRDGTIMIYENIDPDQVFIKAGQTIYPGQPLGAISVDSILKVYLYMIQKDGNLKQLSIKYLVGANKVESFSKNLKNVIVKHPTEIITREMSKREIKKFEKKN
jgi:hypothetical protein